MFIDKMKFKKSQMEVLGLAIIVILVALAVLFVIQFIILKEPSGLKKAFTHKELAANSVSSMLATTTDCKELTIGKLIEDCAEGGLVMCYGGNSCYAAEEKINFLLENTLDKWGKRYYLTVKQNEDIVRGLEFGEECGEEEEKIPSYPCCILPTRGVPTVINLDICG